MSSDYVKQTFHQISPAILGCTPLLPSQNNRPTKEISSFMAHFETEKYVVLTAKPDKYSGLKNVFATDRFKGLDRATSDDLIQFLQSL